MLPPVIGQVIQTPKTAGQARNRLRYCRAWVGRRYRGSVAETGTTNSLLINPVLPSDGTLIFNQSRLRSIPLIKVPCLIVAPGGEPKRGSWRS